MADDRIDAQVPMRLDLEEEAGRLNLKISANATTALKKLWAEIEDAGRKAFDAGNHFAVGPITHETPSLFEPFDITKPVTITVEVKAGPVDDNFEPPAGWRVFKRPADWGGPAGADQAE